MSNTCCAVKACIHRRYISTDVSYHRVPARPSQKRVWENALGYSLPYYSRVCSKHFLASVYQAPYGNKTRCRKRLKGTAKISA
uniref:THAP-type domain-containing protein n=1 Tax=Rhipicephalus appendiculatus TaxID=34631 RepID=A0A131YE34_RHIAP